MKEDLRMSAKSPDPDDLATDDLPTDEPRTDRRIERSDAREESSVDRSAPHVPPLEKGRIRINE